MIQKLQKIQVILIVPTVILSLFIYSFFLPVKAEDIDSTNYKIKDITFGPSDNTSASTNYKLLEITGDNFNDERFSSTNYKIGIGQPFVWMANVPLMQCFETTTDGSTDCEDADVTPDGMVMVCGTSGCYDRARFEIDPQGNPTDALYSIQITTDEDWVTWDYIDGATFLIENASNHDIDDYLTESQWEGTSSNINVLDLDPSTQYYIRATALSGDFTETLPSPDATATTGSSELTFDVDIAGTGGSGSENSSPYTINIGRIATGSVSTASNLIWMDIDSNAISGSIIEVKDAHTGLYTVAYTIASANANLDSASEGYGLTEYTVTEEYGGPFAVTTNFGQGGNIVGGLSTSDVNLYTTSSNPINHGRASVYVKARASTSTPSSTGYVDTITLTASGTF